MLCYFLNILINADGDSLYPILLGFFDSTSILSDLNDIFKYSDQIDKFLDFVAFDYFEPSEV